MYVYSYYKPIKNNKAMLKINNNVKIIQGKNKGLVGVITSIDRNFTKITLKIKPNHRLYGFEENDLLIIN